MKVRFSTVFVENQDKALRFYTLTLGFMKKSDIPMGVHRYLSVVSPEGSREVELLLEPTSSPDAKRYQQALYKSGNIANSFSCRDLQKEYNKLKLKGVKFTMPPTRTDDAIVAIFDDTCGNLIQIFQDK